MSDTVLEAPSLDGVLSLDISKDELGAINEYLESLSAQERVKWAFEHLPSRLALVLSRQ